MSDVHLVSNGVGLRCPYLGMQSKVRARQRGGPVMRQESEG
jgi:hypothetical protein